LLVPCLVTGEISPCRSISVTDSLYSSSWTRGTFDAEALSVMGHVFNHPGSDIARAGVSFTKLWMKIAKGVAADEAGGNGSTGTALRFYAGLYIPTTLAMFAMPDDDSGDSIPWGRFTLGIIGIFFAIRLLIRALQNIGSSKDRDLLQAP